LAHPCRSLGKSFLPPCGEAHFETNAFALSPTALAQALFERLEDLSAPGRSRSGNEHTYCQRALRGLHGPSAERHGEHGSEASDEAPTLHSITWSARCSSDCGMVRPRALADFRLITSSSFVGCSIGRSLGLAPVRLVMR